MKKGILALLSAACLSAQDGAALYKQMCAGCHEGGADRAPSRQALANMSADRVLAALESGAMISVTSRRTADERRAIAQFVSGKSLSQPLDTKPPAAAMCRASEKTPAANFSLNGPQWNGWGAGSTNARFQQTAGFSAADVPRLKVKWAFGFPGELTITAQPTLAGGRVFIGSPAGTVYSLDAATGCIRWTFDASSSVRTAISVARVGNRDLAFFGDGVANAYAVEASTGKPVWKTKVDNFPVARITGSPVYHNNRLYVPVASGEEGAGASPDYECCKFRGSLVALDAATGKQIWKTYTIDEPKPTTKNKSGTQLWGPSGAPIWTSPAIDDKRHAVYVTTGDNYTEPTTRSSDAFMALDMDTGKILWTRQMTPNDAYTAACRLADTTNCPSVNGPDYDFASSPILVNLPNGKRALVAGQKSAVVHALDPDQQGEVLWSVRIGRGGTAGGVQWGSATDGTNVYVALSDIGRIALTYSQSTDADPKIGGGMFALRLADGKQIWKAAPPVCPADRPRCSPAQSAAVSALPGIAFSGAEDGHLRAYSATDGKIVWDFDTAREYKTVNGIAAHGGSLDGPGPALGGGMMFVSSGYASSGGAPGNVLIAFSPDAK
ncbi:MAG TPA: PQQ-binding-like beta-propeller repeat protein [Bryobacteraceae bacterium]|jgi:polyvinyl alcohol dehydrogenase (cytochrome)